PIVAQRGASTYLRPWLMNHSVKSLAGPYWTKMNTTATTAITAQNTQKVSSASHMPTTSCSSSFGRYQYTAPRNAINSQSTSVSMCKIFDVLKLNTLNNIDGYR